MGKDEILICFSSASPKTYSLPRYLATVCTSLSPRPEQLIIIRGLPSSWGQRVSK
ncbi:hypothetical protein CY0110_16892 [Crocosphaera chwakensis CCY0110]|uniref:Uncharacterized protein n=1 Tax=Crocosphaera chwakensis CCY0110 TaxID=391612 RepID=A3II60_9CHRO|nr:hypothetical protein CY0110_16892 [Crocosphaera chwakensis CCY0110]